MRGRTNAVGDKKATISYFIWEPGVNDIQATCIFEKGMTWQEFIDSEYNVGVYNAFAPGGQNGLYMFMASSKNGGTPSLGPNDYPGVSTKINDEWNYPLLTDKIIPEQIYETWV